MLISFPTAVRAFTIICTLVEFKSFYKVDTNKIRSSLLLSKNNEQHKYPKRLRAKLLLYVRSIALMCTKDASWLIIIIILYTQAFQYILHE